MYQQIPYSAPEESPQNTYGGRSLLSTAAATCNWLWHTTDAIDPESPRLTSRLAATGLEQVGRCQHRELRVKIGQLQATPVTATNIY